MQYSEYITYDATDLAALIRKGEVSSEELQQCAVDAINRLNPRLNAVVETLPGHQPCVPDAPFSGVPFLIKDSILHAEGIKCEFGSRLGEGLVSPEDSYLMKRFRQAGFATIGRTTTPEFSFNITGESLLNGPTCNPWDTSRIAGGSSTGSASAVAAGIVPVAHANDGGGSIRVPAGCCGLIGLKPTRGRVSTGPYAADGLNGLGIEFAVSRSVRDTAATLDAVQGAEPGDPYIITPPEMTYSSLINQPLRKLRIAVSATPSNGSRIDAESEAAFQRTIKLLQELGHEVVEAAPSYSHEAFAWATTQFWAANIAAMVEHLAMASGRTPDARVLEATTLATCQYGQAATATDLLKAMGIANDISRNVAGFCNDFDLLLTPTNQGIPAPLGVFNANDSSLSAPEWIDRIFTFSPFTALFNMTGQPAISLPLQRTEQGLPIGMQFVAPFGQEGVLLQLAKSLEEAMPWPTVAPLWQYV